MKGLASQPTRDALILQLEAGEEISQKEAKILVPLQFERNPLLEKNIPFKYVVSKWDFFNKQGANSLIYLLKDKTTLLKKSLSESTRLKNGYNI